MASIEIDKRAEQAWERAQNAYQHYVAYLQQKPDKLSLSMTDLVYVKNFKGGSSTIGEPRETLAEKLAPYEKLLRQAHAAPAFRKSLGELNDAEYKEASRVMIEFANLPNTAAINGFGVSFSTALLHFYFPTVVPILDRRALSGAGVKGMKVNNQGQVENLLELYPDLIHYFRARLREDRSLSLRSLDRLLFIRRLDDQFGNGKAGPS